MRKATSLRAVLVARAPEEDGRALEAVRRHERQRADLDVEHLLVANAHVEAAVGGQAVAQRAAERQIVGRQELPDLVEGAEARAPFLALERPDVLEARPQQLTRRIVEEHDDAIAVDQKAGEL